MGPRVREAEMVADEVRSLLEYDFDKLFLPHGRNLLGNAKREVGVLSARIQG